MARNLTDIRELARRLESLEGEVRDLRRAIARKPKRASSGSAARRKGARGLGTRMAAIGPWPDMSMEDVLRVVREGRAAGGSVEPPKM